MVTGNGTTVEISNYNFVDKNPIFGVNYYRLKQVDFEGAFEYSKILNIEYRILNNEYRIFPNPVQDELTVSNIEDVENITIYNAFGQIVRQLTIDNKALTIDVSDLDKGVYILQLQKTNGTSITKQFVK